MSAAFALQPSGPPVPCDFPRCTLEAFHEGEHVLRAPKPKFAPNRIHTCKICGLKFAILGESETPEFDRHTCGDQACIVAYYSMAEILPLVCSCPQRPYPHELSVHAEIRSEWWAHKRNLAWPWSLMASSREEPSTERKQG